MPDQLNDVSANIIVAQIGLLHEDVLGIRSELQANNKALWSEISDIKKSVAVISSETSHAHERIDAVASNQHTPKEILHYVIDGFKLVVAEPIE